MNLKHQILSFVLIIIVNILTILPASALLLFAENGDQVFVIMFGVVNAVFLRFRLKINLYTSFILGFLNVAICVYLMYLWMYFNYLSEVGKFLPYLLLTVFISWIYIKVRWEKFNIIKLNLILFLPVLFLTWSAYHIKNYYQPKTEREDLTQVEFKIQNSDKNPKQRESIEIRVSRNPLFGLPETKKVYSKAVDRNGACKFILSKNHNYRINVSYPNDEYDSEEITSKDLKLNNKFIIPR